MTRDQAKEEGREAALRMVRGGNTPPHTFGQGFNDGRGKLERQVTTGRPLRGEGSREEKGGPTR